MSSVNESALSANNESPLVHGRGFHPGDRPEWRSIGPFRYSGLTRAAPSDRSSPNFYALNLWRNIAYILGRESIASQDRRKATCACQHALLWTDEVWDGSLAAMLCEWLSKPEVFQPLYTIFVQGDAGTRRAVLDHRDMEALVKRADFPAKRLVAA
jgi:hypothetical protein